MRPLSLGRRRRSRAFRPSAFRPPRPPLAALCGGGRRAAPHSSAAAYGVVLRPLRSSAASLAPAGAAVWSCYGGVAGLPVPEPHRWAGAVGARYPSVARSCCRARLGGGRRVCGVFALRLCHAATLVNRKNAEATSPRAHRAPAFCRAEENTPSTPTRRLRPRNAFGMPRRRAFLLAEGICALSRTQCFVPSPPTPSRRAGVRTPSAHEPHAPPALGARSAQSAGGRSAPRSPQSLRAPPSLRTK